MLRTHTCGELSEKSVGKDVALCGWVGSRRDHGNIIFIDLRDGYGLTQVVFNPQVRQEVHDIAEELRPEFVVKVEGKVALRPAGTENPKLKTGLIEIHVERATILNRAATPPFEISDKVSVTEETRLKYRYLDLRRLAMQNNLRLRHKVCKLARDYFDERNFVEVETPILTKSTPEGARDYLVPSRVNHGMFYALPQSPQLFKQILMVSAFDRYFQIAKCFRDEDLRADRQPEFTQFDIEMSFVTEEDIYALSEGLMKKILKESIGYDLKTPFPRLKYSEAMARFGCDKPDTRFGLELCEITDLVKDCQFKIFQDCLSKKGRIIALNAKGCGAYSRGQIDQLIEFVKEYGAKGLANFKVDKGTLVSQIDKFFSKTELAAIKEKLSGEDGDMIFIVADKERVAYEAMSALRKSLGHTLGLIDEKTFSFLWVTDFPLFKYNDEEKRWESEHHPFTSVHPDDIGLLEEGNALDKIRSRSYDLVINGTEIGSGSIRIHERKLQELIFKTIGITDDEAKMRFGFLLDAFKYGAPPHGGVAFGLDRLMTFLVGCESIRDCIAFPKTQKAFCPMTNAPSDVDEKQLKELGIKIKKEGV
ncbi:MAG: aspartate--tRNA ligase [Candidatus Omnitrophica bacterium]|nr:aspartate--tRNA ligase [Candidatus Omnitrophota bacterium]MDD5436356.1 aspartate--tRNA ligase [Candidatus Omnitrophota bacterium]